MQKDLFGGVWRDLDRHGPGSPADSSLLGFESVVARREPLEDKATVGVGQELRNARTGELVCSETRAAATATPEASTTRPARLRPPLN